MAPSTQPTQQAYSKDERVLCFHHELLYEAKVLDSKLSDASDRKSQMLYRVHYKGWKNTWDDWVSGDRVRKLTDENRELAQNLKKEFDALRKPPPAKITNHKKKAAGSDLSSTRGSEERQSSAPATGRGQKRGRDSEIEKVGSIMSSSASSPLSDLSSNDELFLSFELDGKPAIPDAPSDSDKSSPVSSDKSGSSGVKGPGESTSSGESTGSSKTTSSCASNGTKSGRAVKAKAAAGRARAQKNRKRGRTAGLTPESDESATNADYILSRTPPPEERYVQVHPNGFMTNFYGSLKLNEPAGSRKKQKISLHPQVAELDFISIYRENKLYFFLDQDHDLKIMIAGVPLEGALHPLRPEPSSFERLTPSVSPERDDVILNGNQDQDINAVLFQEESFHSRAHVRIPCPDTLKSILVDDWENVTKNLLLVPLPSKTPVNYILDTYFEEEKGKRRLGSAEADLLEEVVAGVKEYFDKCLGRILLYRFEREQFFEVRSLWEGAVGGAWEGKGPGDVYGAEHLARLFVSLPELIAQTNMDHQAVIRLREELTKITLWLGKNVNKYFTTEYESASQEYIDKARGV